MSEDKIKDIFSRNLKKYMSVRNYSQSDLIKALGVSSATASDWCNGKKMPRSDKLALICQWLHIELNELMSENEQIQPSYYVDPETANVAQEIFENPDLRALFDASRDSKPEDLRMAADLLTRLKETNRDG